MQKNSIIIPVIFLSIGSISAYLIFAEKTEKNNSFSEMNNENKVTDILSNVNPFVEKKENSDYSHPASINNEDRKRLDYFDDEISQIKQQLKEIKHTLAAISETASSSINPASISRKRSPSFLPRRLYNLENLIKGGIASPIAEDIVRRKNSIELKRLELQDRAKRDNS